MSEELQKQHDLAAVWDLLHAIDKKLDLHIQQYNKDAPSIRELSMLLDRSKGILVFMTWVSVVGGIFVGAGVWIKNHVTL